MAAVTRLCRALKLQRGLQPPLQAAKPSRPSLRAPCGSSSKNCQQLAPGADGLVTLSSGERVHVDKLGYRPNVAVVLFNGKGEVFTCRRLSRSSDSTENWQYPQGGIDPGEDPREAALRELTEETSVSSAEVVLEHPEWLHYDFDARTLKRLSPRMNKYRGQKQKYFLMKFTGDDSEIDLCPPGHMQEFDAYEWVDIWDAPGRVVGFKRHVYENVARTFEATIKQHVR